MQQQQAQPQGFEFNQGQAPYPFPPFGGFMPPNMPPWGFGGPFPAYPPPAFAMQPNQWVAPTNQQNQVGDFGRGKNTAKKSPRKRVRKLLLLNQAWCLWLN
jgi:hypothetical protein